MKRKFVFIIQCIAAGLLCWFSVYTLVDLKWNGFLTLVTVCAIYVSYTSVIAAITGIGIHGIPSHLSKAENNILNGTASVEDRMKVFFRRLFKSWVDPMCYVIPIAVVTTAILIYCFSLNSGV